MKESKELPGLRIRRGGAGDVGFVQAVALDVFGHLGDYGRILPTWLLHDGVLTHVALKGEFAVGFTMLGFYPVKKEEFVADLLAIAVASSAQERGVGRCLLEHAIQHVRAARRRLKLRELRLSVADTNLRARKLFLRHGFQLVPSEHGWYDGGQLALHMKRSLAP